jgi:N-methylhydantoinase A/oxoprolinase/acetone carboxylase beta subunit
VAKRLAIDVGGTFTDLVLIDSESGQLAFGKVPTTTADPSEGALAGVSQLLAETSVQPRDVEQVIHATTLVGNAVIERKGCRTALITTKGFRDVLTLGREFRYDIYDSNLSFPPNLVPRRDRFEVNERITAAGDVLVPMSDTEVEGIAQQLIRHKYEAVAVCLLHSYRNPVHEKRIADLLAVNCPGLSVSISSEILAQSGEFERTWAAVINAYVQPLADSYLNRLASGLRNLNLDAELLCISSNGGLVTAAAAARQPIRLLESGPVAGALGASHYGRSSDLQNLLSFDMGGTTAKACLIKDGAATTTNEYEVARLKRLTKGSGYPVKLAAVDMLEIGSGGGSIAHVDELGLLSVGPESAGAFPGPACYGRGGKLPTVTDANLLLGYLNADFFLGGHMQLDVEAADKAVRGLAATLGLSTTRAAYGIHEVVSQAMASALQTHAIEKGVDYRNYSLVAFGGAGPVHAYRIAELLRISRVVFPWGAGVFSAYGLLTAPFRFDVVRTLPLALRDIDRDQIHAIYSALEAEPRQVFVQAGLPIDSIEMVYSADIRYVGQGVELEVESKTSHMDPDELASKFLALYTARYGWTLESAAMEVVNWRCSARGPIPETGLWEEELSSATNPRKGSRLVYVSESRPEQECAVYDRYSLRPGALIQGPALIEERECTVFIGPHADATVDSHLNVVMQIRED